MLHQLREWLVEKKGAQEKLASYLEDVAIYLGVPGRTVSGWLEAQRDIRDQASAEEGAPTEDQSVDDILKDLGIE